MIKYLLCAAGGVGIGYYIAHTRLEQRFHEQLDREIEEARDFYRRRFEKKAEREEEASKALKEYQGVTVAPSMTHQELNRSLEEEGLRPVNKAFADVLLKEAADGTTDDGEDEVIPEESEIQEKEEDKPRPKAEPVNYNAISTPRDPEPEVKTQADDLSIITQEEFVKNETGYKQFSISYFAEDDVLAGESDQVIELQARQATLNDTIFERLKDDRLQNLYVRNSTTEMEFEITRSSGSYQVEVLDQMG